MNRRFAVFCVLAASLGCRTAPPPDEGTSVGNPGGLRLALGPGDGLVATRARLAVASLRWTTCTTGAVREVVVNDAVDLLDSAELRAPAGEWCTVELVPAGPLRVEATGTEGGTATLELALPAIVLGGAAPLAVDGAVALLVEVGDAGWVDAAELGLAPGLARTVDAADPLHDALVGAAVAGTAVYADDGDGSLSDAERAAGAVAATTAEAEAEDEDEDEDEDEEAPDAAADTGGG